MSQVTGDHGKNSEDAESTSKLPPQESLTEPSDSPPGQVGTITLKQRLIQGSAWTIFGYGAVQVLRLVSNLVLTRLLFPEAFGLIGLANILLTGIQMFSDLGIEASVIQNKRGEEPSFLHTAWAVQILRGFILWMIVIAMAWPISVFYNRPELFLFLPALGFIVVMRGFTSANLFTAIRRIETKRLAILNIIAQVASVVVTCGTAYYWRSVWVLIVGAYTHTIVFVFLSHTILGSLRMRFEFRRDVVRELIRFGKWIFLATILGYIANRGGHLVLGKFMALGVFGVYSIAALLAEIPEQLIKELARKILFPLYSRTAEYSMDQLRQHTIRIRRTLLLVFLPPTWLLVIFGPEIITILFDDRYLEAGWMLQVLGVRAVLLSIIAPMGTVLLAVGNSRDHMVMVFFNMSTLLLSMLAGGMLGGVPGILIGLALGPVLYYPFLATLIRKQNSWIPSLDASAVIVSVIAVGIGLWAKGVLGLSF